MTERHHRTTAAVVVATALTSAAGVAGLAWAVSTTRQPAPAAAAVAPATAPPTVASADLRRLHGIEDQLNRERDRVPRLLQQIDSLHAAQPAQLPTVTSVPGYTAAPPTTTHAAPAPAAAAPAPQTAPAPAPAPPPVQTTTGASGAPPA